MKIVGYIGKILFGIGFLYLFLQHKEGHWSVAGYVDKTWEIAFISLFFMAVGLSMIYFARKTTGAQ